MTLLVGQFTWVGQAEDDLARKTPRAAGKISVECLENDRKTCLKERFEMAAALCSPSSPTPSSPTTFFRTATETSTNNSKMCILSFVFTWLCWSQSLNITSSSYNFFDWNPKKSSHSSKENTVHHWMFQWFFLFTSLFWTRHHQRSTEKVDWEC